MTGAILLIEDNAADAELARLALSASGLANPLLCLETPEYALVWLDEQKVLPALILLDLAFPGHMTGLAFLAQLRSSTRTQAIPVIALTAHEGHRVEAYGLGVNAFLTKPVNGEKLVGKLRDIGLVWYIE